MRLIIQPSYDKVSKWAANYVASRINEFHPNARKRFVLGLPTGSSPIGMYAELIKIYKQKGFVQICYHFQYGRICESP
jgi:glucosamine-6-phosphate deaminase